MIARCNSCGEKLHQGTVEDGQAWKTQHELTQGHSVTAYDTQVES